MHCMICLFFTALIPLALAAAEKLRLRLFSKSHLRSHLKAKQWQSFLTCNITPPLEGPPPFNNLFLLRENKVCVTGTA